MASVIVDFPPSESKSIKSLGEFILHKLPPLSRYIYIPKLTRAHDPWLYLNEPIYGNNAPVLHSTIMTPSPHNREPTEAIHKSVADDKDKNSNAKGIEQNDNVETDVTIANVMNTATPSNDATTTNVVTASNKKDNTGIDITDKNVKSSNATADNLNIIITSEFNTVTQTTSDTSAASAVKESDAITMRKDMNNPYSLLALEDESVNLENLEIEELEEIEEGTTSPKVTEEEYYVQEIMGSRIFKGRQEYEIHWMGYDDPGDYTWEPIKNLQNVNVQRLITKFEEENLNKSTKTDEIIEDIASLDDAFEKEVNEIGTLLNKDNQMEIHAVDESTPFIWETNKSKIDDYFKQKEDALNKKHHLLLKQQSDSIDKLFTDKSKELIAICKDNSTTAVSHIYKSAQGQKDILTNISNDTINSCTNLFTKLNDDVKTMTNDVTMKIEKHDAKNSIRRNKQWNAFEKDMKQTFAQLSKVNTTAIKNTKILESKLNQAEKKIDSLEETISLQKAMIDDMTATVTSNDKRLAQLRDLKSTEYASLVDTVATKMISSAIKKECKSILSEKEIYAEFSKECEEIEKVVSTRIENIAKHTTAIIQDNANKYIKETYASSSKNKDITESMTANIKSECNKICSSDDITNLIMSNITKACNSKSINDELYLTFRNKCKEIAEEFQHNIIDIMHDSEDAMQNKAQEIMAANDIYCNQQNNNHNRHTPNYTNTDVEQQNPILGMSTSQPQYQPINPNARFPNVNLDKNHNHPNISPPMQHGSNHGIPSYNNTNAPQRSVYPEHHYHDNYNSSYSMTNKAPSDQEYFYNSKKYYVNISTFYKLQWNCKCQNEVEILTFYKTLQHMASTCGIPLRDLDDVDETHGVCPLTIHNCSNYEKIYKLMSGAIFYKINDESLWDGYNQGWNLIKSNILHCDGFEVLYDILAEVLPKLNKNTAKSHKIQKPSYTEMDDDNIYTYISAYNAFLEFESLGSNSRNYTPHEITVYIADDLEKDPHKRFDKGISYVRQKLERSPDGVNVAKDISLAKIAKTICKYSPEYVVGEYKSDDHPTIRALKQTNRPKIDYRTTTTKYRSNKTSTNTSRDPSVDCSICGQKGHDVTTENGCHFLAKWTLCKQANEKLEESKIKNNTRRYLKHLRRQQSTARKRDKIEKRIRCLQCDDDTASNTALIHSLQLLQEGLLDDLSSCSSSEDEE